jgi:hypothetical protein
MAFFMLRIVAQTFFFLFFLPHTRTFFCFCVLLLLRTVRVSFSPQPTNAYLIATILTDMEQVVMIEFLTVTIKT